MTAPKYSGHHPRLRRAWAPIVAAGGVRCARCGEYIVRGQLWHLDHDDSGPGYLGPSHRSCNVRAGQATGAKQRAERRARERTPDERAEHDHREGLRLRREAAEARQRLENPGPGRVW